jgi:hypothetical protein
MRSLRLLVLSLVVLLVGLAAHAPAQTPSSILVSLAKTGELASGRYLPPGPTDLLGYTPGASTEVFPFVGRQSLDVIVGDVDRDGELDDAPLNVDAVTRLPGTGKPTIYDLMFSFVHASTKLEGGTVLDGDLVQLVPGGGFKVVVAEAVLASITGTRTIDVDAATVTAAGELIFSFTDDEATTSTILSQQYQGYTLHDEAVLGWKVGTSQVRVVLTKTDVLKMVSKAVAKTLTSVVDLTGLAPDPTNAGELLFTVGSSANGLEGAVFTTAGGGAYASINNTKMDGASPLGLKSTPSLDALTVFAGGGAPLVIEAAPERLVTPTTASPEIRIRGATPGKPVQLFATFADRPAPTPFPLPAPITGAGHGYLSLSDPLLALCPQLPFLRPTADGKGEASVKLPIGGVPAGVSFVVQAVDLVTLEVSEPVAVDLVTK